MDGFVSDLVPERDDARQQSDEDVCVNAPFMGFIDDYHIVSLKQKVLQHKTVHLFHESFQLLFAALSDVTLNAKCHFIKTTLSLDELNQSPTDG